MDTLEREFRQERRDRGSPPQFLDSCISEWGDGNMPVEYAGLTPGFFGLDQINIRLSRIMVGRGDVNVSLSVDGIVTNTVQINIR